MDGETTQKRGSLGLLLLAAAGLAAVFWFMPEPLPALPYHHTFKLAGVIPAEIKVYHRVDEVERLFAECEEEAARCVSVFNKYDRTSELSVMNREAVPRAFEISEDMRTVLGAAFEANRATGGAFDVTVQPLIRLWKEAAKTGVPPEPSALEAVTGRIGMDKVAFDREKGTVRFTSAAVTVDLGGVSKGYIVDRVTELLRAKGVKKGLVNIGGDMRVFGGAGDPFTVGVQDPRERGMLIDEIHMEEGAVATSGDYARYVEIGGKRYSHIIDPRSGMPVSHNPSVTVLAGDAMTADWLATGLSVLGAADGIALVEKTDGAECLIIRLRNNAPEFLMSEGMKGMLR
jgi:thiamine biosynthesis lipoprotein